LHSDARLPRAPLRIDFISDQKAVDGLVERGSNAISTMIKTMGLQELLLDPPVENAMNMGDYACFMAAYKLWAKAFFDKAGLSDPQRQVPVVELKPYTVWVRSNSTISMVWTYDSELKFD